MKVVPFKTEHFHWLMDQPRHDHLIALNDAQLDALENCAHSYSVIDDNGDVLMCGGLTEYWSGRAEAWATFNRNARSKFIRLHKIMKRFFQNQPVKRVEAAVQVDYEAGIRLVSSLGFVKESDRMQSYLPDGSDCALFARIG